MKELLEDPETLPFKRQGKVSLGLLKKEIDRRIRKIKGMLGCQDSSIRYAQKINQGCQTSLIEQALHSSRILSQFQEMARPAGDHKQRTLKRCSLPVNKSSHQKQTSLNELASSNHKVRLIDYLSSMKPYDENQARNVNRNNSEPSEQNSDEKRFVQTAQQERIFSSRDLEQFSDIYAHTMKISFHFGSDEDGKPEDFDSGGSEIEIGQRRLSAIGRQTLSNKKIKFTDRTAVPDAENRIIVTEECKARMAEFVQNLIAQKRREGPDNKVRENLIKKIDDKFGDCDSF